MSNQRKEVRFIAINNGIDSEKQSQSGFTPFLNIMNGMQEIHQEKYNQSSEQEWERMKVRP